MSYDRNHSIYTNTTEVHHVKEKYLMEIQDLREEKIK